MNLVADNDSSRASRRSSVGFRRGSRLRGDSESCWHSSSCRIKSSSYNYDVYLRQITQQQRCTYLYDKQPIQNIYKLPDSARAAPLPIIQVTRENRRTSISSPLRFTRTFSSDSIDSLEKRCIQELKVQKIMETERPKLLSQTSMIVGKQPTVVKRQLSYNPKIPETSNDSAQQSLNTTHRLQRSTTDPENQLENESGINRNGSTIRQTSLQRYSPPSISLGIEVNKRSEMKRSTPDLTLDGVFRNRTLSETIGLSVYQQKLLTQCWPNIFSTGMNGNFASNLYSTLCKRNPKAKQLMQKADGVAVFAQSGMDCTTTHTKLTLELIDMIVRNLDSQPGPIIAYLNEIGQCHRSLRSQGITVAMWDDLGDALLEGVRKNDLVRKHKELRRAWLSLIAFITDNIKQAQTMFRLSPSADISEIRSQ